MKNIVSFSNESNLFEQLKDFELARKESLIGDKNGIMNTTGELINIKN